MSDHEEESAQNAKGLVSSVIVVMPPNMLLSCYVNSYSPEVESTEARKDGIPVVLSGYGWKSRIRDFQP